VWVNGVESGAGTAIVPASITGGIGIGGAPNGTNRALAESGTEWCAAWSGVGIYAGWVADSSRLIKRLSFESLGLRETQTNSKYWAYDEFGGGSGNDSGNSFVDHNGRWWFAAEKTARAGNPKGLLAHGYATNSVVAGGSTVQNCNPTGAGGWVVTGGALAAVSDAAALLAANARVWGPNVYQFTNISGTSQIAYANFALTAARIYHFYLLARYSSGANAELGFYNTATTVFTSVGSIQDGYALTRFLDQACPTANDKFAIRTQDQTVLLFIGHALLYRGALQYPPPYRSTPWSNETQRSLALTEHTPTDLSGSYLIELAPTCWSTALVDQPAMPCVTTAGDLLHAESVAQGWATSDGTTQIQTVAPYIPAEGVYVGVWTAWKLALQYIQQGVTTPASLVTGPYDGIKGMAGALQAATSLYGAEWAIRKIQIRAL
jgi:hypothetical protein